MLVFPKIWPALFSCNTCFKIRPFALLPSFPFDFSAYKIKSGVYLRPCQTSMIELFSENSSQLPAVTYFFNKPPLQIFD